MRVKKLLDKKGHDVYSVSPDKTVYDALKIMANEELVFELKATNKPGVLRSGNEFTYVIMPVNLQ